MDFKKGDELSITYCVGHDAKGESILETLDNAVVESFQGGYLEVSYKVDTGDGGVGITRRVFNATNENFSSVKC